MKGKTLAEYKQEEALRIAIEDAKVEADKRYAEKRVEKLVDAGMKIFYTLITSVGLGTLALLGKVIVDYIHRVPPL